MTKGKELKPHIGVFGKRNAGKSSLINVLTGQNIAIVSEVAGTTTDLVKKTMEIKGVGPVVLIDTAGIDDIGSLGEKRVEKTMETINIVDLAIVLFCDNTFGKEEELLVALLKSKSVPFVLVHSKSDLMPLNTEVKNKIKNTLNTIIVEFSENKPSAKDELIKAVAETLPETAYQIPSLLGDVLQKNSLVLLVVPIDSAAPEGRLILPQVQLIRDILDNNSIAIVCKGTELEYYLQKTTFLPDLVVVDSQIFDFANKVLPKQIPLTSFSIVLAKGKGLFNEYIAGTQQIANLKTGDRILLLESCTHHATCEDIGRVKIPTLFKRFTNKDLNFEVVSGLSSLPRPVKEYAMVVQCGGCVVTKKQLLNRILPAVEAGVPISNYGMAIAYMNGIFERGIEIFKGH